MSKSSAPNCLSSMSMIPSSRPCTPSAVYPFPRSALNLISLLPRLPTVKIRTSTPAVIAGDGISIFFPPNKSALLGASRDHVAEHFAVLRTARIAVGFHARVKVKHAIESVDEHLRQCPERRDRDIGDVRPIARGQADPNHRFAFFPVACSHRRTMTSQNRGSSSQR